MIGIKTFLHNCCPPILVRILRRLIGGRVTVPNAIATETEPPHYTAGPEVLLLPQAMIRNNNASPQANDIQLLGNCAVAGFLMTFNHGQITIGSGSYIGVDVRIWSARQILIGDRVLVAHGVNIFDNTIHPVDDPRLRNHHSSTILHTGRFPEVDLKARPVVIEDDAWIGCNVIILSGVRIGQAAVVGAGAVVTHDVPPWTVVGGNPARILRRIEPQKSEGAL